MTERTYKFTHWRQRAERRRKPWLFASSEERAEQLLNSESDPSAGVAYYRGADTLRRRFPDTDPRPVHDALVARIRAHRDELRSLRRP